MGQDDIDVRLVKALTEYKKTPSEQTVTYKKTGPWGKAVLKGSKAKLIQARTQRHLVFWPLILTLLFVVFLVSPSISIIIGILRDINPIVWIGAVIVAIYLWRKYV